MCQWCGDDTDGNVVVVNIDDNAVITYNLDGEVVRDYAAGGNDGVVVLPDTAYVLASASAVSLRSSPVKRRPLLLRVSRAHRCATTPCSIAGYSYEPQLLFGVHSALIVAAKSRRLRAVLAAFNWPSHRPSLCHQAIKQLASLKMVLNGQN